MKMVRYYTTPDGGSRFEDLDVPDDAGAVFFDDKSESVRLVRMAPKTFNDWHYTPVARQLGVITRGQMEIVTTDGERRVFGPGDIFISDNLGGKGHTTRVLGEGPLFTVFAQLPPSVDLTRYVVR